MSHTGEFSGKPKFDAWVWKSRCDQLSQQRFFPLWLVGASDAMSIGVGWETPAYCDSDCNIGLNLIFVSPPITFLDIWHQLTPLHGSVEKKNIFLSKWLRRKAKKLSLLSAWQNITPKLVKLGWGLPKFCLVWFCQVFLVVKMRRCVTQLEARPGLCGLWLIASLSLEFTLSILLPSAPCLLQASPSNATDVHHLSVWDLPGPSSVC